MLGIVLPSYTELQEENQRLRAENAQLRLLLEQHSIALPEAARHASVRADAVSEENASVTMRSSAKEKIALFRSFFRGREDVFARRWYSKTTEKSGYQPVCGNEWEPSLCDKRKFKCGACPNRKLLPLTDGDIYDHLAGKDPYGRDVVGVYPLSQDDTCCFCCVDFDGDGHIDAAKSFYAVCDAWDVPCAMERSRSGNGTHVWMFFAEPVPAKKARTLSSGILTAAMEQCKQISFSSYDRMIPNQDTMPSGGFGNLVALPLQGMARRTGNSLFMNEDYVPYADPWAFLSCLRKITTEQLDTWLSARCKQEPLGSLVTESDEKPWKPAAKKQLAPMDFPADLPITCANMLYIPTEGLSAAARNAILRLAAFKNPDFYRAQAMRMPIYDKPRIICTAEITEQYIGLPRGCETALRAMLDAVGVPCTITDETNAGTPIPVSFNGSLREEQQPAADALLQHNTGVLSATTAFGKTVVASYLIAQRQVNTLVLVHTQALMEQWKKSLEQFMIFDVQPPEPPKGRGRKKAWSPVGQIGAGKDTLHGMVDVAVMQSLIDTETDSVKELVRGYGMVIADECHHVSAVNFEKILKAVTAKYVYGLTATPTRQDGHHPIIFMQCGEIRYRVDAKAQAEKRPFEHFLIPRFTSFRKTYPDDTKMPRIYKDLEESELRNRRIADDITEAVQKGRTPIVLTERREHVLTLAKLLRGKADHIVCLTGAATAKEKRAAVDTLESIPDDQSLVVLATGKYVGEGFDYPRLDTLFVALPISWKGKVAQYAGRLHRDYPGKTEVRVYDYADIHVPVLERMYQKRLKSYASIGYKTKTETRTHVSADVIYDGKSFCPVYKQDLANAMHEIRIVSPFMRRNRLQSMKPLLEACVRNGTSVIVTTRPPEDFADDNKRQTEENLAFLQMLGVQIDLRSGFHQKFTIVDQKIVWYGSVNFLSFGTAEESLMRFESSDVAGELLDTVE